MPVPWSVWERFSQSFQLRNVCNEPRVQGGQFDQEGHAKDFETAYVAHDIRYFENRHQRSPGPDHIYTSFSPRSSKDLECRAQRSRSIIGVLLGHETALGLQVPSKKVFGVGLEGPVIPYLGRYRSSCAFSSEAFLLSILRQSTGDRLWLVHRAAVDVSVACDGTDVLTFHLLPMEESTHTRLPRTAGTAASEVVLFPYHTTQQSGTASPDCREFRPEVLLFGGQCNY